MYNFLKSVGIALQNIKTNPLHTFLSTLGIIIGVASLVAILALGDGLEQSGREQLANTTSLNILNLTSDSHKMVDDIRIPVEDRPRFTLEHARFLESKYEGRSAVEMIARTSAETIFRDSVYSSYIQGSLENGLLFMNDPMAEGRFFSESEIDEHERVALLSHELAVSWKSRAGILLGEEVSLFGENFKIIGILPESTVPGKQVLIPVTVLDELQDVYAGLSFKVVKAEEIPLIKNELETWLDETFEAGHEGFSLVSNESRVEQFSRSILLFKLIMGAITGISVLVGGIGVMNVLLISVTERTKEIGIRKATGAKRKDIVMQFMSESITISVVGCVAGWVLGMLGLTVFIPVVNNLTNAEFSAAISLNTVLFVMLVALIIGLVFGTYPAWRASRLDPIDAIRHE